MHNYLIHYTTTTQSTDCISNIIQQLADDGCRLWADTTWFVTSNKCPYQIKDCILKACSNQITKIIVVPLPAANDLSWSDYDSDNDTWFNNHL